MDVKLLVSGVVLVTFVVTVCGIAPLNSRIVGGDNTYPGEWPWQASLHIGGQFMCGATLINSQWVYGITTTSLKVYLGRLALANSSPNEVLREVRRAVIHPRYSERTKSNDIALLELSTPVAFTNYIRPVCLAAQGSDYNPETECWITGWGRTKTNVELPYPRTLQEARVQVTSQEFCNNIYGSIITSSHMCASSPTGSGICVGDGGGPLLRKHDDRWVQSGVMSFISNLGCGIRNAPDGYTRVSSYQSWIQSQITSNPPGFVFAGSSGLVSLSVPLLFAVSLFGLMLF
ncbi:testisin-like [Takifugu rubripes]|uniref:testisin-like n=1 Tax=Takifugu rubripes TaxID=31033 RepID=UPI001145B307|nr:testisin-like [Takifugu rubripes]